MQAFRKEQMEVTRRLVAEEKADFLNCYEEALGNTNRKAIIFPALDKRLNTVSVRSSMVFLVYDYLEILAKKEDYHFCPISHQDLTKLAFLTDASMSVMYMYNHIYDHKSSIRGSSKKAISRTVNNANQLILAICNYAKTFPPHYRDTIASAFNTALSEVEQGQDIDINYNFEDFFRHVKSKSSPQGYEQKELFLLTNIVEQLHERYPRANKDVFWTYFNRIYLLNSSLLREVVNAIITLTQFRSKSDVHNILTAEKVSSQLLDFVQLYGIILQIVNDISDFVFDTGTSNKEPEDTLSDLKNSTVSLPIMLHVLKAQNESTSGIIVDYIQTKVDAERNGCSLSSSEDHNQHSLNGKHNHALRELIESGAIPEAKEIAKDLAKIARKFITKIKSSADWKSPSAHLRAVTSIVDKNRFYWHIDKAEETYRKGILYETEKYPSKKPTEICNEKLALAV